MSVDLDSMDKKRTFIEFRDDMANKNRSCRLGNDMMSVKLQTNQVDSEKRVRREIANCNERRRMQSINSGFDSLRVLLPPMTDGEKVSKATILQLTAKYINSLVARVQVLENEIAIYRRTNTLNTAICDNDFEDSSNAVRKRKVEEQKKNDQVRVRRRKVDANIGQTNSVMKIDDSVESDPETGRSFAFENFGNLSVSTEDLSPPATSISYSSESPRQENASCAAARLEHLVMAIEQIEGGRPFTGQDIQGDNIPTEQSHELHSESMLHSSPENFQHFTYTPANKGDLFSGVFSANTLAGVHEQTPVYKRDMTESSQLQDYPVVTKLVHRPIPHKYLHRPQVVVNSTH